MNRLPTLIGASVLRFFRMSVYSFKALFYWRSPIPFLLTMIVAPIVQMLFFSILCTYRYPESNAAYYAISNSVVLCCMGCVFAVGNIISDERMNGTLSLQLLSQQPTVIVFISRGLFFAFSGMVSVLISVLFASIVFSFSIPYAVAGKMLIYSGIGVFSTLGFGLMVGSFGFLTSDAGLITNIANISVMFFSGALFPIDELPWILRYVAKALPLHGVIPASRALLKGTSVNHDFIIRELIGGVIYYSLGILVFNFFLRYAKKTGKIDHL